MKPPPPPLRIVSIPPLSFVWQPLATIGLLLTMAGLTYMAIHRAAGTAPAAVTDAPRDNSLSVTPRRITNVAKARRVSLSQLGGAADPSATDAMETALDALDKDLANRILRAWHPVAGARGSGAVRIEINPSDPRLRVAETKNTGGPAFEAALEQAAEALRAQSASLPSGWDGGAYEVSLEVRTP